MKGGQMATGQDTLLRWTAPHGNWTEPDLHLFPQDGHRYEIVDGSLHVTPPLDAEHERVVQQLVSALRAAAPDGWWACSRVGIRTGDCRLVPDIAVLRPGSSGTWTRPADVALVVEVESPASRRYDRLLKPVLYAEAGITAYWRAERDRLHLHELVDRAYGAARVVAPDAPVAVTLPYPMTVSTVWI